MSCKPLRVTARWLSLLSLGLTFSLGLFAPAANSQGVASDLRRTAIVRAVEQARPSVVNIHGHKMLSAASDPAGFAADGPREVNGMGTGVVIDERGYVITNFHVVEGVRRIQVTLHDGKTYIARLVAHDPKTDLAVIHITAEGGEMPVVKVGTSKDLMPGEPVIAVGNAFGYEHTVTRGIISALHRDVPVSDTQKYNDLIQTDASINPGNSGGPLLNIDGEMIGINVAVRIGAQGIGFAIPVDQAMEVAARLLSVERLDNHYHGIVGRTDIVGSSHRFIVASVRQESPGAKSGIKPGDVISAIGGKRIDRSLDLERALLGRTTGEEISVLVERENKSQKLSLQLASTPRGTTPSSERIWNSLGMKLENVPSEQVKRSSSRYRGGLRIVEIEENSQAAREGIRRGDILVGMHIWETVTAENVLYVLDRPDFQQFQPVKMYVLRDSETLYTHLPITTRR